MNELVKLSHQKLAPEREIGATVHQFAVPEIELVRFSTALLNQPEEVISLEENLVVSLEGTQIARVGLAVGQVQVAAAKRGGTANEFDVLGAKYHHIYLTYKVDGAAWNAIYPYPLLNTLSLLGYPPNGDLHLNPPPASLNLGKKASHGDPLPWGRPIDQLPLRSSAMRFGCGQQVDGLQKVGLPLGIIAPKHHQVFGQVKLQSLIIAEVGQAQVLDVDATPPIMLLCCRL